VFALPGFGLFLFGWKVPGDDLSTLIGQCDTDCGADTTGASSDKCDFLFIHIYAC
jgi:hypothetical protein